MKNHNNPHFQSAKTFQELIEEYDIIDDLWGGTRTMRRRGTTYLPREPKETVTNYNLRLNRAVLKPFLQRTIMQAVGKAFTKPITVNTSSQLSLLETNADQAGTSLEKFAKELLTDAIKYGVTYLMVDFPVTDGDMTLADEMNGGMFPYFVNIKPTQLLDLHVGYENGSAQLNYFRFLETVAEVNDYVEEEIDQVKEMMIMDGVVTYNIYRRDDNGREFLYYSNTTSMTYIPIVPVYSNKIEPFLGSPLLIDLAYANIEHYQKSSDIDVALHMGAMPMLVLKGFEPNVDPNTGQEEEIVISPNSGINVSESGDASWLELNGSGINTYMQNLKECEANMSMLGLELTSKKVYQETATGRMLDEQSSMSMLKSACIDLESALTRAFDFAADYLGTNDETEVIIDTSLAVSPDTNVDMIIDLVRSGIMNAEQGLEELRKRMLIISDPNNPND